jgi:hypothetical protein
MKQHVRPCGTINNGKPCKYFLEKTYTCTILNRRNFRKKCPICKNQKPDKFIFR